MSSKKSRKSKTNAPPDRIESLDAFRGFTIFGMVFVIIVSSYGFHNIHGDLDPLPWHRSWFGSIPVSTFHHAETAYERWFEMTTEWLHEEHGYAGLTGEEKVEADEKIATTIKVLPEFKLKNIGVTFCDLIAPWFVFIVGVCIPLSRARRGGDWWRHVLSRTFMLILAGVIYIALVIKHVTWWWGILQAIGIAYFCGAATCRLKPAWRWIAVFAVGFINLALTESFGWWTGAFEKIDTSVIGWGSLSNPGGSWLKPWIIHCQPWLSVSYGTMTMIGVLLGEAIITRDRTVIAKRCLLLGLLFMTLGWTIHRIGFATGNLSLCMNKADVTTSYAFFAAGTGAIAYLFFYWIIDVWKIRAWAVPLIVFGINPLLAYFMQIIMRRAFESLGVIEFSYNVAPTNKAVNAWADWMGDYTGPSHAVLEFFDKGGMTGVFWGLVWTFCLWLIILWCNRKKLFWRL